MVKHIKKSYSKDGKLTDREKSIAYATAWKHHNKEETTYDSSIGGHEWGTPKGTDYMKSFTPGQHNPKEDPIRPLDIKARKPEDEKAVKVTEAYPVYKTPEYHKRMKAKDAKLRKYREGLAKKAHTTSESLIAQFEPEYSEAKRRLGNKIRGKLGVKKKPELNWKKDAGIKEDFDLSHIEDKQADHSKHQYPKDNAVNAEWEANLDGILTGAYEGGEITWEDVKALDKDAENFSFDDAVDLGLYDEDELALNDFDEDPHNDTQIHEALSVQGRMKRRFAARRNRQKLKVARRIALRRGSTPDRLKRRATRGARLMVYKRLLRGRDRASLPPAEKARLEKMITRFQPLVNRVAVKLLPQMRRNEINRMKSRGGQKPQTSKKYRAAKPIRGAASQKAKRYKIKGGGKYKQPKKPKYKSKIRSGGPTLKKASKAYKAFTYSVG